MRKFLLISLMCMCSALSYAQNSQMAIAAQRAFNNLNYKDAVEIYTGVVAAETNGSSKKSYEQKLQLAKNCLSYIDQANYAYNQKKYQEAINLYGRVMSYNSKDTFAKNRIQQCNNYLAQAKELNYWGQIVERNTVEGYREYLKKYPNGLYVAQAKNTLKEVDYWKQTLTTNTKVAYVLYLKKTTVNWHKEEAQSKVDYFTDQELWVSAQKTNTEAAYKGYLTQSRVNPAYVANANAMIALFDARRQYKAMQYTSARSSFESYKKLYIFSSSDNQLYLKCCEESDYASFLASSESNKSDKGKIFLKLYPKSAYIIRVKSEMSRSYATSYNFGEANLYAQNKSDRDFIKTKQKAYKKAARATSKYSSTSRSSKGSKNKTGIPIALGVDVAYFDFSSEISSYSPNLRMSIGDISNTVNFELGLQYRSQWGRNVEDDNVDESIPSLSVMQIGVPVFLRFNLINARKKSIIPSISVGASYNYNISSGFAFSDLESNTSFHNASNISSYMRFGLAGFDIKSNSYWDFSFVVRYDVTPSFNKDVINNVVDYGYKENGKEYGDKTENLYEKYESVRKTVDSKWFFGFSITRYWGLRK